MTTDPIADMLTRIRNGLIGRLEFVDMPVSKVKIALAKTMRKEGFIRSFDILEEKGKSTLRIQLAYIDKKEPAILHLKRVSRPGLRIYTRRRDVPRVQSDLGIAILSTSKGVMTGKEAWQRGLGGEVLCYLW